MPLFPSFLTLKTGYLASTSAHMMLPLARSRTTPGSSGPGVKKERSPRINQLDQAVKKEDSPELRKRHSRVRVYTVTGSLQKLIPYGVFLSDSHRSLFTYPPSQAGVLLFLQARSPASSLGYPNSPQSLFLVIPSLKPPVT